jgi:hypothetical protein
MADPESAPDIYADQFNMAVSPYGVALTFMLTPSNPTPIQVPTGDPKAVVRMSLEHAKVMAMVLRRSIKQYELETLGDPVRVPRAILAQLKLSEDDW